jgi:aerobic-type carbon monoxide dehydrogenase small subunit (CoxS/CutS family)
MLRAAQALLVANPPASARESRGQLAGYWGRCGTPRRIRRALKRAPQAMGA